ncbi:hypothetical protein VaNZ11_008304 [Volvox africanus]|uniref:serine O-acetyltransferase n=1 Tax=Volvox africanus TaxID=51714 RepID=A0ABQ5S6Q8_9CHLO|nr:hypothetical protein VaNZ11_008304 [Volvox africanus]
MSFPRSSLQRSSGQGYQPSAGTSARVGVTRLLVSPHRCPQVHASRTENAAAQVGASKGNSALGKGADDSIDWIRQGVPVYLQSSVDIDVCDEESQALTMGMAGDLLWNAIRSEAQADAATEPLLSSFLYASILAHNSFDLALGFVLSNRLANSTMLPTQLFEIFHGVLRTDPEVRCAALSDIAACRERDPACAAYSHALLYYKGYHAIQTQRIAHALWRRNQKVMALALQSRMSEVFAVDIHPAARIGKGVLLDHGTGVVIGETAVIGNNVSILQNVTLGGTGKEIGDRHPKVGDNVLIGACATILGNIQIGKGAQIAAGSLVLKPVPAHTLVAGSPAKEIGPVLGNPALSMRHWSRRLMDTAEPAASAGKATETPSSSTTGSAEAGIAVAVVEAAAGAGGSSMEPDMQEAVSLAENVNGNSHDVSSGVGNTVATNLSPGGSDALTRAADTPQPQPQPQPQAAAVAALVSQPQSLPQAKENATNPPKVPTPGGPASGRNSGNRKKPAPEYEI